MEKSVRKRIIIAAAYLAVFALVVFGIYSLLKPEETCVDGVKNQNEEDIDCGGVCKKCEKMEALDLKIINYGFLESGAPGEYDFWAMLENPNGTLGTGKFRYEAIFKDAEGRVISQKTGESFILPGEKKYIVENNILSPDRPVSAEIKLKEAEWVEFIDFFEEPNLKVINKKYEQITSGVGFSQAVGLLKNESPYDFDLITIRVVLRDASGKVLAVNSTEMRTVRSGDERGFEVDWPGSFPGDVSAVDVQPEVNIFSSEAFLKSNFRTRAFQRY
ncbi:MAG: hypothetical protein QG620_505 [Patescibacteria group bacterium]|nr:hypothetical protein [Patescibacteria group bacterium]